MAVGAASPVATCVSAKPVGSVAAGAAGTIASAATQLSNTTVFLENVGGAGIIGGPLSARRRCVRLTSTVERCMPQTSGP